MKKVALFLDRDGVINKNPPKHDYVKSWDEFILLPGVSDAIKLAKKHGFLVIVISNQRGVARGFMSEKAVKDIHKRLNEQLSKFGTSIDAFYFCSHDYKDKCGCRKPRPGLILKAASDHEINLSKSILIGDSESDRLAGIKAHIKTVIILNNRSLSDVIKSFLKNE